MASYYVYSGASGTGDGSSWTNAYTTLVTALSGKAAGSIYYVANDHSESSAAEIDLTFNGTASAVDEVLCVSRAGSVPPVAADLTTGGQVATTGTAFLIAGYLSGSVYIYGLTFRGGNGSGGCALYLKYNSFVMFTLDHCTLSLGATGAGRIYLNRQSNCLTRLLSCTFNFSDAQQFIDPQSGNIEITSCALSGTVPTALLSPSTQGARVVISDSDISSLGSGHSLVIASAQNTTDLQFANCKLGASVTVSATPAYPGCVTPDVIVSDSGAAGYRQERYRYEGTLTPETTIVRSGGASDGITPISWKIVSTANAQPIEPFRCFEIPIWNSTTGSSVSATVELVNDGTTLTNNDVWMEIDYLGSASYPQATLLSSAPATILTAATNLTTSSATWTTTGLTTPVKQKITLTFTPQIAGFVYVRVRVSKASKTIYVDPLVTLS